MGFVCDTLTTRLVKAKQSSTNGVFTSGLFTDRTAKHSWNCGMPELNRRHDSLNNYMSLHDIHTCQSLQVTYIK